MDFLTPLKTLWPVSYLEVCYLVSKCLKNFQVAFWHWFLVWFHYGERTHTDDFIYFKFIEVYFMLWGLVYVQ